MKAITGAILILAASVFYHARTELADRKIGNDERMEMIRICRFGAGATGVAGVLLIWSELLGQGHRTGTATRQHSKDLKD